MEKTFIEEPSIGLLDFFDHVSEEAKKEKLAIPPIAKMLYYWTRKPLVVGKAVALTSTLNDIVSVQNLSGLGRDKRAYLHTPDAAVFKKKLGVEPSKIKVLDPFGGAGNLIFEAKRLGLDCTCSDYNPVAFLLEKAVLEYPSKYGTKLAEDFEKYANQVLEMTKNEVGKYFNQKTLAFLWVWCIKCPHCAQRVPLTNQMWIANTARKKIGIQFHITKNKDFVIKLINNMSSKEGQKFTQKGGSAKCINCTNMIDYETLTNDIAKRKDREMIVTLALNNKNRIYVLPDKEDKRQNQEASTYFLSKVNEYQKLDLLPSDTIKATDRKENRLWKYGIKYWKDFFSDRQKLIHVTMVKNIKHVCNEINDKEYAKIISLYLGFLLCKHMNMNALGTYWINSRESPSPVVALRQPSIIMNHVEINPFQKFSGAIPNMIKNIVDAIKFASLNKSTCKITLQSVTKLPKSPEKYDLIITDPPYLDDVIYGETSEFFYVWLYRCIKDFFPELPNQVPLEEDFCEAWGRFGDKKLSYEFFEKGLKKSFVCLNEVLKDDGLTVIFFAHSTTKAWNLLLECIRNARFSVVSSYAIHTESTSNVIARGKTSFMSSILVVCRKQTKESTSYFEDIIPQTEDNIKDMIDKIPIEKLLVIPITDLLIMVYGKVLETCTQYTELKSYEKDFHPDFETLIKSSQGFIMKSIITKLTDRSLNTLGSLTAFYLLIKIFHRGIISADDVLKISKTFGINVDMLEKNNIGKKEGNTISLYYLHEHKLDLKPEEIDRNNIHQQICYLVQVSKKQGTSKIKPILSDKRFRIDDLKQIISLLIKSFRFRINKNEKLNDDEKEELQILEGISDVMGIKTTTKTKGGLDKYFEN